MALHRAPLSLRQRILRLLGGATVAVAAASLAAAGPAAAAPKAGAAKGHLILTVDGKVVATAGPGKALRLALAECATRDGDVAVTVADVRAAFPNAVAVCDGVTLTSQVAADEDEAAEA